MPTYKFDGKNILDDQGNPVKDNRKRVKQYPGAYSIERADDKPTLENVNSVRENFGLNPIEDETTCPQGVDLSGSYGQNCITWNGREFCIVPYDDALKSPVCTSGDGSGSSPLTNDTMKNVSLSDPATFEFTSDETVTPNPSASTLPKSPIDTIGDVDFGESPGNTNQMNKKESFILLSQIEQDDDTFRCREQDCNKTTEKYKEIFKEYKERNDADEKSPYPFPPVLVLKKGKRYILVAGYHRLAAARKAGIDKILVRVLEGTEEEAVWIALTDNQYGLPLKDSDLKRCIIKALKRCPEKSQGAIAAGLWCSRSYVSKIAKQLVTSNQLQVPKTQTGRDGKLRKTKKTQSPPASKQKNKSDDNPLPAQSDNNGSREQTTSSQPSEVAFSSSSVDEAVSHIASGNESETNSDLEADNDSSLESELDCIVRRLDDLKQKYPEDNDHNYIFKKIYAWLYSDPSALEVLNEFAKRKNVGTDTIDP